jgi:hypothetical protein
VYGCGRYCGGHGDTVVGCDLSRENMSLMMGQCGRERDRCGKTRGSETKMICHEGEWKASVSLQDKGEASDVTGGQEA